MPKLVTTTHEVFKFAELDYDAQQKALSDHWDINIDQDWHEATKDDISSNESALFKATVNYFDCERSTISFKKNSVILNRQALADKMKPLRDSDRYQLGILASAKRLILNSDHLGHYSGDFQISDLIWDNQYEVAQRAYDYLEDELNDFSESCLIMLRREYESVTSAESIQDSMEANEFEFLGDGSRFYG